MCSYCDGVVLILALLYTTSAHASECSEAFLASLKDRNITEYCKKLNTFGAEFGWKIYHDEQQKIDIVFGAKLDEGRGWIAWGVNPGPGPKMVGTRALIGIVQENKINTYNITRGAKMGCGLSPSEIDIDVSNMKFSFWKENEYDVIEATLVLPSSMYNISRLNIVWQVGSAADGVRPRMHVTDLQNFDSTETINLRSGLGESAGQRRRLLRMVHGVVNIVGWGVVLPIGVILVRYSRKFPLPSKQWFSLHISCQILGYILGTTGWIIGLWLGHASKYYFFATHRLMAIFIFTFTTLQMLALRLKPNRMDEFRKYWDMYHHFLGYALIALICVNIFKGIAILKPENTWKWAYVAVLGFLGAITLALEIFTWFEFIIANKKRSLAKLASASPTKNGNKSGGSQGTTDTPPPSESDSEVSRTQLPS